MKILFLHPNFPAQFRHLATVLGKDKQNTVVYATNRPEGQIPGVQKIIYEKSRTARAETHHYVRPLENAVLELEKSSDDFQDQLFTEENNTTEAFERYSESANILHLTNHVLLNKKNSYLTSIVFEHPSSGYELYDILDIEESGTSMEADSDSDEDLEGNRDDYGSLDVVNAG